MLTPAHHWIASPYHRLPTSLAACCHQSCPGFPFMIVILFIIFLYISPHVSLLVVIKVVQVFL